MLTCYFLWLQKLTTLFEQNMQSLMWCWWERTNGRKAIVVCPQKEFNILNQQDLIFSRIVTIHSVMFSNKLLFISVTSWSSWGSKCTPCQRWTRWAWPKSWKRHVTTCQLGGLKLFYANQTKTHKVIMLLRQTVEKFHFTSRYWGPISCFGSSCIMHYIQLMFNKWLKQWHNIKL